MLKPVLLGAAIRIALAGRRYEYLMKVNDADRLDADEESKNAEDGTEDLRQRDCRQGDGN